MEEKDFRDIFFVTADPDFIAAEKARARELRQSQWWKRKRSAGVCHYCGGRFPARELTMDHIVPVVRGGRTTKNNVVPCCKDCNSKKKYMLPLEWEEYMANLSEK